MWRHIDVQADRRRRWTYGRAPIANDISYGSLTCPSKHRHEAFLYNYFEKPPHLVAFYDTLGIRRTHSRLNPWSSRGLIFWPRPGFAPGYNNTCKEPWVLHPYQVSSKSIKRFWRRSWNWKLSNGRRTDRQWTTRDHNRSLEPLAPTDDTSGQTLARLDR